LEKIVEIRRKLEKAFEEGFEMAGNGLLKTSIACTMYHLEYHIAHISNKSPWHHSRHQTVTAMQLICVSYYVLNKHSEYVYIYCRFHVSMVCVHTIHVEARRGLLYRYYPYLIYVHLPCIVLLVWTRTVRRGLLNVSTKLIVKQQE
jgi:hypothetical protein